MNSPLERVFKSSISACLLLQSNKPNDHPQVFTESDNRRPQTIAKSPLDFRIAPNHNNNRFVLLCSY